MQVPSSPTGEVGSSVEGTNGKESDEANIIAVCDDVSDFESEIKRLTQERNDALLREKETKEQNQALMEAVDLLGKLASMDNDLYTATLTSSCSSSEKSCGEDDHSLSSVDPDRDVSSIQSRLDALQANWKLEETSLPMLLRSIHRLQSNNSNLIKEVDQQTLQMQSMEVHEIKAASLEKAIHKLHRRNRKLHDKLLNERKSIVKSLKYCMEKANMMKKKREELTIEEQRMENQLKRHERIMRMERIALDDGCMHTGGGNRSRGSTFESFPDSYDGNRSRGSTLSDPQEASSVVSSVSGDDSTTSSLVTDDGVATIRFDIAPSTSSEADAPKSQIESEDNHWSSMRAAFGNFKSQEKVHAARTYSLTFQTGAKIGLQFHKVQLEKDKTPFKKGLLTEAFFFDRKTPNACNANKDAGNEDTQSQAKSNDASPPPRKLSKHFKFDSMLRRSKEEEIDEKVKHHTHGKDDDSLTEWGFLVCGYDGFDSAENVRPNLGARLVAVDQLSLETGNWTLSQVREALHARASKAELDGSSCTFTLSFREEPLNRKQRDILERAVKTAEGKRHQNKDKEGELSKSDHASAETEARDSLNKARDQETKVGDAEQDERTEDRPPDDTKVSAVVDKLPEGNEHGSESMEKEACDRDKSAQPGEKLKNSMKEMSSKFKAFF